MTASQHQVASPPSSGAKSRLASSSSSAAATAQNHLPNCLNLGSSAVFQQVKQTQASLARLSRVHQQLNASQTNSSSQGQQSAIGKEGPAAAANGQQQSKSTTFVDCLIRRFKDCFSEDYCTVPMFVVGNLSPGSDGTHLIFPPCVSLGRQSISRFAGPKNIRLMNSIRESCRSIEELDLGGNKLTDLIEIYKILQCTPNLKFLNLSENDLSRSSPVALAASTCNSILPMSLPSSISHLQPTALAAQSSLAPTSLAHHQHQHGQWSSSSMTLASNRTCLGPLNQNQDTQHVHGQPALGVARRHSTFGQPVSGASNSSAGSLASKTTASSSSAISSTAPRTATTTPLSSLPRTRQTGSRVAEARRLAAAAAVAQSKKTSSLVASKLANSATAAGVGSLSRSTIGSGGSGCSRGSGSAIAGADGVSVSSLAGVKSTRCSLVGSQRHQASPASTMHLARSLSSLSAKDVRNTSASLGRLSAHRSSARKESNLRSSATSHQIVSASRAQQQSSTGMMATKSSLSLSQAGTASMTKTDTSSAIKQQQLKRGEVGENKLSSSHKLFVEPIVETDHDVDMSEQQVSPSGNSVASAPAVVASGCQQQQQQQQSLDEQSSRNALSAAPQTGSNISNSLTRFNSATTSSAVSPNFKRTFESIKALALNNTGCQWRVVCSILSRMPNLEELHLSLNNYERIDLDPNEFKHHSLKRLYLCNNPKLTNWQELDKLLSAFPSLEALSIADCNISQIPDNLDRAREWRKLCGLNINGWPIKEWPIIERLNQLPSLIDLKCRNLEILNTIDEPRHHLIARLPKLQRLNGSEIEEREHAEKAFLRFFMANSHLERPTRFHELVQIHGEVIPVDVDVDLSPPSQASVRVIYLNRNYYRKENEDDILMSEDFLTKLMDNVDDPTVVGNLNVVQQQQQQGNPDSMEVVGASSTSSPNTAETDADDNDKPVRLFKDDGQEVIAIEIDLRQSVRKFKATLASFFGLHSQNLILYYIDREMVGLMGPELIKHNQKKLWNYNVQDGDQFIVEER